MPFGSLWLPVVLSSLVVWIASAIAHTVLRHHRADYRALPNEAAVAEVLRKGRPAPGMHFIPHCTDPGKMKDPEVVKKFTEGPVAIVTVLPSGPPSLGKHLVQWLGFCFLASFVSGYIARHTLIPGADGVLVLRITGTVAFAGYAMGYLHDSIWKGAPWSNSLRAIADAVVYAILTGLVFMLLWPAT